MKTPIRVGAHVSRGAHYCQHGDKIGQVLVKKYIDMGFHSSSGFTVNKYIPKVANDVVPEQTAQLLRMIGDRTDRRRSKYIDPLSI